MIKITNLRTRGGEPPFDPLTKVSSLEEALEDLVIYELAFGGHVTDCTPTKVVTVTRVMECVDTTVFEGTEEDMAILVEFASTHLAVKARAMSPTDAQINMVMKATRGVPLLIKLGADMIIGQSDTRVTLLAMFGTHDEKQLKLMLKPKLKDLLTMFLWVREGNTLEDVLCLA